MTDKYLVCLFHNALESEIKKYRVNEQAIRTAMQNVKAAYEPIWGRLSSNIVPVANYNDSAHRCAYLFKNATLHTALVRDVMIMAREKTTVVEDMLESTDVFKICCLGGGPGSDVLGILASMNSPFRVSVTIVDLMVNWKLTFHILTQQLCSGQYGGFGFKATSRYFQWKYIEENLLDPMSSDVSEAVADADLVTMVKFISASSCKASDNMIQRILETMKPGALLLSIENGGGGFQQLLLSVSRRLGFLSEYGPIRKYHYANPRCRAVRFGYTSNHQTTVAVNLLQKPFTDEDDDFSSDDAREEDETPPLSASDVNLLVVNQPRRNVPQRGRNGPQRGRNQRRRGRRRRSRKKQDECGNCCCIS